MRTNGPPKHRFQPGDHTACTNDEPDLRDYWDKCGHTRIGTRVPYVTTQYVPPTYEITYVIHRDTGLLHDLWLQYKPTPDAETTAFDR